VGYDISPLKRVKLKILTTSPLKRVEKYRNPQGQLKENLFLPLFNTNFISKSFKITDLTTCRERHETF
jgi:hypothetical protein